jgi:mycoredoxin
MLSSHAEPPVLHANELTPVLERMPSSMENGQSQIVMYTTDWCAACWRAKQVMSSLKVAYSEIDIEEDEDAREHVMQMNRGYRSVPTIVFPDGTILTEPSTFALVQKLQPYVDGS